MNIQDTPRSLANAVSKIMAGHSIEKVELTEAKETTVPFEKMNNLTPDQWDQVQNFKNFNEKEWKWNATQKKFSRLKKVKEEAVEEGNEFTAAAAKAKLAGKDEFEFDGKTYPVEIEQDAAEKILGKKESVDLEEASNADLKKVLATAKKLGADVKGNTADFGQGAVTDFSIEKGKIKFDGGKSSGVEYYNNAKDAIGALMSGVDESIEEAVKFWTVTVTKKAGKLFKGQTVDVKASNSAEAIKKGLKQMKVDNPMTVPSGSVNAVLAESLKEALKPSNGKSTVGLDVVDAKSAMKDMKKFKLKTKEGKGNGSADEVIVTGKNTDIFKYLTSAYYDMDTDEIEEFYPELYEGVISNVDLEEAMNRNKPDDVRDAYGKIELTYRNSADRRSVEALLKKAGINVYVKNDTLETDSDSPAFKKAGITKSWDSSKREKMILKLLGESTALKEAIKDRLLAKAYKALDDAYFWYDVDTSETDEIVFYWPGEGNDQSDDGSNNSQPGDLAMYVNKNGTISGDIPKDKAVKKALDKLRFKKESTGLKEAIRDRLLAKAYKALDDAYFWYDVDTSEDSEIVFYWPGEGNDQSDDAFRNSQPGDLAMYVNKNGTVSGDIPKDKAVKKALDKLRFKKESVDLKEATELYKKGKIALTKFAMGKGKGAGLQVNYGMKFIQIPKEDVKQLYTGMAYITKSVPQFKESVEVEEATDLEEATMSQGVKTAATQIYSLEKSLKVGSNLNKGVNKSLEGKYDADFKKMQKAIGEIINVWEEIERDFAMNEVEEPKAQGEKDFKALHAISATDPEEAGNDQPIAPRP